MAYLLKCPSCQQEGLDPRYSPSPCLHCGKQFSMIGFCPVCHSQLLKMQCCSVGFFCNTCNELVSKKQARFTITPCDD
jgi:hypothetical protein